MPNDNERWSVSISGTGSGREIPVDTKNMPGSISFHYNPFEQSLKDFTDGNFKKFFEGKTPREAAVFLLNLREKRDPTVPLPKKGVHEYIREYWAHSFPSRGAFAV